MISLFQSCTHESQWLICVLTAQPTTFSAISGSWQSWSAMWPSRWRSDGAHAAGGGGWVQVIPRCTLTKLELAPHTQLLTLVAGFTHDLLQGLWMWSAMVSPYFGDLWSHVASHRSPSWIFPYSSCHDFIHCHCFPPGDVLNHLKG